MIERSTPNRFSSVYPGKIPVDQYPDLLYHVCTHYERGELMAIQYESKARANMKYRATHLKRFAFDVNKSTQPKLFDYIESVNNVQGYIRNLIYEDMKKQGKEID